MTYRGEIRNKFGSNLQYVAVGFSLNAMNYFGDLSPMKGRVSTDISLTRPGFGFFIARRVAPRVAMQGEFIHGVLKGSDSESAKKSDLSNGIYRYYRNLAFRNRVNEFSVQAAVDLYKNQSFYTDRVSFTPYVCFGIAVFHHNPQARVPERDMNGKPFPNAGEWVSLREFGTEGQFAKLKNTDANYGNKVYSRWQPGIPFGIGARVRLSSQLDLSADFSMRCLFTDYLDDVSKNYVDLGVFGTNELGRSLSYRTNEVVVPTQPYVSEIDGRAYAVVPGYGREHRDNMRGNRHDNDFYTSFTIRAAYIVEKLPGKRPKYR